MTDAPKPAEPPASASGHDGLSQHVLNAPAWCVRSEDDMAAACATLAESTTPHLIGVRHHSPVLAAAVKPLLDAFAPDVVAIELPTEFGDWIEWLCHEDASAPLALAGQSTATHPSFFYPFADFSPELAAMRWAREHGVRIELIDLPAGIRDAPAPVSGVVEASDASSEKGPGLVQRVGHRYEAQGFEEIWDRVFESMGPGQTPESLRRAGLYLGWALRRDECQAGPTGAIRAPKRHDLMRETFMRSRLTELGAYDGSARVAAVVGSFHASALLATPKLFVPIEVPSARDELTTSLVPYSFELFDSRSGYPAGIRDPRWQQDVWRALSTGGEPAFSQVAADAIVRVCRALRKKGHVAGVPDGAAAMRLVRDLATIRGLSGPGRREIVEALETSMAQGELLGRGRALAAAMNDALVGRRRGRLAEGTPRSGLFLHVEKELQRLRLPGPSQVREEKKEIRLDPHRSARDREKHILLHRLSICGVPYGDSKALDAIGQTTTLTKAWDVSWTPQTEAQLEFAGLWGVTLEMAAAGALAADARRHREAERWTAATRLQSARLAAEANLPDVLAREIPLLVGEIDEMGLGEVLALGDFMASLRGGHIVGIGAWTHPSMVSDGVFFEAALRAAEGLGGSTDVGDARAVAKLCTWQKSMAGKLMWLLGVFRKDGGPLMQGAATVLSRLFAEDSFAEQTRSWVMGAHDRDTRRSLSARIGGMVAAGTDLMLSDTDVLEGLVVAVDELEEPAFLERVRSLRAGFAGLSTADRQRCLAVLAAMHPEVDGAKQPRGSGADLLLTHAPEDLARWALWDTRGRTTVAELGGLFAVANASEEARNPTVHGVALDPNTHPSEPGSEPPEQPNIPLSAASFERWRLILGVERNRLNPLAQRRARALEELYGAGQGEGSDRRNLGGTDGGSGGGQEDGFPTVREWSDELIELFGADVREEVLAAAAEDGQLAALFALDPEAVTPSIDLLESVLALKGGMPAAKLDAMRKLVARIVRELTEALATRLKPALVGLASHRPTPRGRGPIDLRETVRRNLKTVHRGTSGAPALTMERVFFRERVKKSMDWRVVIAVDVSGSMLSSAIHSAMVASILHAVPAISVQFVAFNTQVLDLSEHVADPLELLMEVEIGGGTHIAKAVRYVRSIVRVPRRTLFVLVTDFEEGFGVAPLLSEVREIVSSGVTSMGVAALDDRGAPRYHKPTAERVVACGMPVAALSPLALAQWVRDQIHG